MLKNYYQKSILFAIILLSIISCKPTSEKEGEEETTKSPSMKEILEFLEVQEESFSINPNEDTLIQGTKGTGILFPAGCFQFKDGSTPNSNVKITIQEFYTISDFIGANLTTTSNGHILETGGMIHLTATSDNRPLSIKNGKEYSLYFPKNGSGEADMTTFYGERNEEGKINWLSPITGRMGREASTSRPWWSEEEVEEANEIVNTFGKDESLSENVDSKTLQVYTLSANKLGWINCDRFWEYNGEKTDFIISVDIQEGDNAYLVFENINSIMSPTSTSDNTIVFKEIPIGAEVKIIAFVTRDDKTMLSKEETTVSKEEFVLSKFNEFTLEDLKELNQ